MADWIEDFMDYTAEQGSPDAFRRWAGIMTISGALERRVWVRSKGSHLYPNLYVFFVADPGIGKSEMTRVVAEFWSEVEHLRVAPMNLSRASLVDHLAESERRVIRPKEIPAVYNFNGMQISIDELGVLLPTADFELMNVLTHLYDCGTYKEKKRTLKTELDIPRCQVTLLAGCTPAYLAETLPEGAWNQGFLSRVILIYAGESHRVDLWSEKETNAPLRQDLVERLKKIGEIYGRMSIEDEAKAIISEFWSTKGDPAPEHPKLFNYNTRRTAHLIKLSTIAAVASGNELTMTEANVSTALDWMIEAEVLMPEIFKSMTSGGAGRHIEEAWYYLYTIYVKEKKPVAEHRLIQFLQDRIPVYSIMPTIESMLKSKKIEESLTKIGKAYTPKGRKN